MDDFDLLVLGDCNPDLVRSGADVRPRFGQQERLVDEGRLTIGGSGAILACAAARLGLRTALAAVVGDDVLGHWMLDQLAGRGVEVGGCVVDPVRPTGLTVVLSEPGDRAILTAVGTIAALRPGLGRLFRQARSEGRGTSVDPNWDPAEAWDSGLHALLPHTDCLLPNAEEAMRIAATAAPATRPVDPTGAVAESGAGAEGGAVANGAVTGGVEAAAGALAAAGPLVAVKLGAAGALAAAPGGRRTVRAAVPSAAAGTVADTTGAGDSFDAGFLYGHLSGWPLDRSLALGCACGALSTRAAGGTAAQPTLDEALRTLGTGAAGLRPG